MKPVWIDSWPAIIGIGIGVYAIVFAVAWREISEAFSDLFRE